MDEMDKDMVDINMARDDMLLTVNSFYDRYGVLFFGALLKPHRLAMEIMPIDDIHLLPYTVMDIQTSLTSLKLYLWRWAEREYGISDEVYELIKSLEREQELFQSYYIMTGWGV